MSTQRVAIVSGITGQDGSILAEQLIADDFKVYGLIRRSSRGMDLGCAKNLENNPNLRVIEGDLLDLSSLIRLCKLAKADHFYNCAAMSHVGTSFDQPIFTAQATGLGVLNCLEAIRQSGIYTRFLQCSTSEMYGGLTDKPANEQTPFHPRSPYGVAKLYGHWATINYRESYKMFACCSICFNHECFFPETPVIIRKHGSINIVYISSLISRKEDLLYREKDYSTDNVEIWDGTNFVKLKLVSKRKLKTLDKSEFRHRTIVNTRGGAVFVTPNHKLIEKDSLNKISCYQAKQNETSLQLGTMPSSQTDINISLYFAELLGLLASEGQVNLYTVVFSNTDHNLQEHFMWLARKCFPNISFKHSVGVSGFENGHSESIRINGLKQAEKQYLIELLVESETEHKKVPQIILNAEKEVKLAFLRGYYAGDGLKKDKCIYEFKSYKSNSPLLCQGLLYLIKSTTNQTHNINVFVQNNKLYHQVNLHSDQNPHEFGNHLLKDPNILKKKEDYFGDSEYTFVYDIETASGVVMAGVGELVVGNSKKRGPNFVTRKITQAVAKIKLGRQDKLFLGNLDARRDWGAAEDYVEGMRMMLNAAGPEDYVLATGETHSVQEFCDLAFKRVGLDYRNYVEVDLRFYRPAEVNVLIGDYSKIKRDLGWEPKTKFVDLVEQMVDHDLSLEKSII